MGVENQADAKREGGPALALLCQALPEAVLETGAPQGDETVLVRPECLVEVMEFLKDDPRLDFDMLADITAVDHPGRRPRFDLVYNIVSVQGRRRLRVKTTADDGEAQVPSLTPLWASANWLEREVWDMFGIRFAGHPDLKRILLYEEFEGHPLRKDYPIRKRQPLIGPKN